MIRLDIISDPVCPWCYIGKTRLEQAISARPELDFQLEWHPFQLNPDMPPEGMERRAYLELKFGGRERAVAIYRQIADAAAEAGIEISYERIERMPNTLDAHRLIHWAGLEGVQNQVVGGLFQAYFQQGQDISDPKVLVDIATAAGIDGEMIAKLLAQDVDKQDIQKRDANARQKGVSGVPCFIINNAHAVTGAQPSDLWLRVFDDIAANTSGPAAG
ncbi:MAG: DsbA family oxidoreductase [Rhodobacteraceae bacterium]|nr:DsbA family oxidoreductase [Paracoccaceae bacterium]